MTKPWPYLVHWLTGAFTARRIFLGVMLIWLIIGPIFDFSRRWLWLLITGTAIMTLLMLLLTVTEHCRQTKTLSDTLKQLDDALKKTEQAVLRNFMRSTATEKIHNL